MTKPMANTMPVSAIIPDAAAERKAWADETDNSKIWNVASVTQTCSIRGRATPPTTAPIT